VFSPHATSSRIPGASTGTTLHRTGCAPKSTFSPKFVPRYPSNVFYILFAKLEFDAIGVFDGQVLKESFKLYRAINDGIINLVDKVSGIRCALSVELSFYLFHPEIVLMFCLGMQFFEMQRHDAVKALEIYKRAGQQVRIIFIYFGSASDLVLLCTMCLLIYALSMSLEFGTKNPTTCTSNYFGISWRF